MKILAVHDRRGAPCTQLLQTAQDLQLHDDEFARLWDDRSAEEWSRGRIPGAVHLDWQAVLSSEQKLLPLADVERKLADLSLSLEEDTIVYCQGGVRAAHSYFVLKELGYKKIRVYDGSWAEYGNSDFPREEV